jgi:hypothetical protein
MPSLTQHLVGARAADEQIGGGRAMERQEERGGQAGSHVDSSYARAVSPATSRPSRVSVTCILPSHKGETLRGLAQVARTPRPSDAARLSVPPGAPAAIIA